MKYQVRFRKLAIFWASFFLLNALLFNTYVLQFISSRLIIFGKISTSTEYQIYLIQLAYFIIALLFVVVSMQKKYGPSSFFSYMLFSIGIFFVSSFVLLELALIPFIDTQSIYTYDKDLGWKLRKNATGRILGVKVETNSDGLRGKDIVFSEKKPRILYLGDSVTFGYMIENEANIFPYQVSEKCNATMINSGVCGYSTKQEYLYLMKRGIKYKPNLVVVSVVLNDITDKIFEEKGQSIAVGFESLHSRNMWQNSRAYIIAQMIYNGLAKRDRYFLKNKQFCDNPKNEKFKKYLNTTIDELQKIEIFCEERGIKSLFVFLPCAYQLKLPIAKNTPQNIMMKQLKNCLDVMPYFHEKVYKEKKERYFLDFWHPTEKGHSLVTEKIVDYVNANEMLGF